MDQPNMPAAVPSTGEPRVDAALARLSEVEHLPLNAHVERYDEVHRLLQDALAGLDEG